jgi:copper chaperone
MAYPIVVDNIKCGGCTNTIHNRLMADGRVREVVVDIAGGTVSVEAEAASRDDIAQALAHLGYPKAGSVEGLKAAAAKAKSFVSCAVGRIDNPKAE